MYALGLITQEELDGIRIDVRHELGLLNDEEVYREVKAPSNLDNLWAEFESFAKIVKKVWPSFIPRLELYGDKSGTICLGDKRSLGGERYFREIHLGTNECRRWKEELEAKYDQK